MTRVERNNKLKHFIACLKCEVSGKCCDDNCLTQYDAGNMGEIIENLEAISKALEQELVLGKIREEIKALLINNPWYASAVSDILQIIDKYKAESEDKE